MYNEVFFIPSSFSGCSQVMPLAIVVLFVRFPNLVDEGEDQVAIFQCNIDAISLEKKQQKKCRFFYYYYSFYFFLQI